MTREEKLQDMLEQYKRLILKPNAYSVQKAELEHDIWETTRLLDGPNGKYKNLREMFSTIGSERTTSYEIRAYIFKNRWAHPLFDAIDKGLKHSVARDMYIRARELANKPNVSLEKALKVILDGYNGTRDSIRDARVGKVETETETHHTNANEPEPVITVSKRFKASVMHLAKGFTEASVNGCEIDPFFIQRAVAEFDASLDRIIQDFQLDISRYRHEAKKLTLDKIGDTRFERACEVLGLKARFGEKLDTSKLNRAFRNRAAPLRRIVDVAQGEGIDNEKTQAASRELSAVNQAYELLRLYIQRKGE